MSSISSLARSAVDIVQERIKIQSGKLTKHIETLLGVHRPFPASQSVVGDMNPTTAICQPLGLPLGNEHPETTLRRSERLAARRCDHGASAEGAEPPEHGWDLYTGEAFTTQILDQPPRPRTYSERGMDVTIIVSELIFPITEIIQLYYLSHTPILYDLEKDRQNTKVCFQISDGYNVTSIHDKANLITYL